MRDQHTSQRSSFACEVCESTFKRRDNLQEHIRMLHKSPKYVCEKCSLGFYKRTAFKKHRGEAVSLGKVAEKKKNKENDKAGDVGLPCSECTAVFRNRRNLLRHMRIQHTKRSSPAICEDCGASFKRRGNLLQHIRNVHGYKSPQYRYLCAKCGITFYKYPDFRRHKCDAKSLRKGAEKRQNGGEASKTKSVSKKKRINELETPPYIEIVDDGKEGEEAKNLMVFQSSAQRIIFRIP